MQIPTAKNGLLYVYVSDSDLAVVYDPVNYNPISNPIDIDSDGYVDQFVVETDILYDLAAKDYLGNTVETRNHVTVLGGSTGDIGPQGPKGDPGDTGPAGSDGADGANGSDGADGADGANGADGISLVSISIDPTSSTARVNYTLSDDPTAEHVAGDIFPGGYGQTKVSATDELGYLANKIFGTDGEIDATAASTSITLSISQELKDQIEEATSREKAVLFGGTIGATSVVIPHTLGTSNLSVSCYDTTTGAIIFLNVVVTDASITISDLSALTTDNQIKVVLIK